MFRDLASWVIESDTLAEPAVEEKARELLLDTLGCMVAGLAKPEPARLAAGLMHGAQGRIRLPGFDLPLTPDAAAYIAGVAACWDEACEGLARAHGRPGLHSFGPALALALVDGHSLGDALRALVAGFEVAGRMGEALRIRPGMHVDGIWGTFGGVAAAARLKGLNADQTVAAIEGVACRLPYSLYLPVAQGADVRNLYVGEAATRALAQVAAVEAGVSAPAGAVAAFHSNALGHETPLALAPPGEWFVLEGYLKPYAAVRHVHYGAHAAAAWRRRRPDVSPDAIRRIALSVYGEAITYCGNRAPATAIQAQFSLSYGLARTLVAGDLGPDAYAADALADPATRRLEALIEISEDAAATSAGVRTAALTVDCGDGPETIVADAVPGDPASPMSRDDVAAKFMRYAGPILGEDQSQALRDAVLDGPFGADLDSILAG